jgi:hypothetical protein
VNDQEAFVPAIIWIAFFGSFFGAFVVALVVAGLIDRALVAAFKALADRRAPSRDQHRAQVPQEYASHVPSPGGHECRSGSGNGEVSHVAPGP